MRNSGVSSKIRFGVGETRLHPELCCFEVTVYLQKLCFLIAPNPAETQLYPGVTTKEIFSVVVTPDPSDRPSL